MTIIKFLSGNKYPGKKSHPAIDRTRSFFYFSSAEKIAFSLDPSYLTC